MDARDEGSRGLVDRDGLGALPFLFELKLVPESVAELELAGPRSKEREEARLSGEAARSSALGASQSECE